MKSGHNDIEQEEGKILFQSLIDFDFSFPEFYGSFHANRHAILNNNCQEPPVLSFFLAMMMVWCWWRVCKLFLCLKKKLFSFH